MNEPWWVEGAEVQQTLEFVAMLTRLAKVQVLNVDNEDGFCLREQLYFDGCKVGLNQDIGKLLRRASR